MTQQHELRPGLYVLIPELTRLAGSLRGGERLADLLTLIHTARLNGLEPQSWLTEVLEKLPSWPQSKLRELLPYRP